MIYLGEESSSDYEVSHDEHDCGSSDEVSYSVQKISKTSRSLQEQDPCPSTSDANIDEAELTELSSTSTRRKRAADEIIVDTFGPLHFKKDKSKFDFPCFF